MKKPFLFYDGKPVAYTESEVDMFKNTICQIIFEGEDTVIGRQITLDRIKECVGYEKWLEESKDDNITN